MKGNSEGGGKPGLSSPKDSKTSVLLGEIRNTGKKFFLSPGFLIIFSIFIVSIIAILVLNSPAEEFDYFQKCGDETFSGYCSLNKPYFCNGAFLTENPSLCGCPDFFNFKGDYCSSEYDSTFEDVYLNYLIDGRSETIYFKFRPDVLDYLLSLPRFKIYSSGETPRRDDFKIASINEPLQREFLIPLVAEIENLYPDSKDMQAKVAVSLVQNIPYNESQFVNFFGSDIRISRYPYQVLGEHQGSCEGKSELLAFLLKEMGFGVVLFYYPNEAHEAVGIKCPLELSYLGTGYCFVETTMPSPISYSDGFYIGISGISKLSEDPEIVMISKGISLSENIDDYRDARDLKKLVNDIESSGMLNAFGESRFNQLREKYNLSY